MGRRPRRHRRPEWHKVDEATLGASGSPAGAKKPSRPRFAPHEDCRTITDGSLELAATIIGDGIQEGVEALTEHLQMHAGIHAGMALVDLSIWSDPAGGLLVVPRVPMRTVLIERGIVTFDPGVGVRVEPPKGAVTGAIPKQRPVTASEPEFYAQLEQTRPDHPGLAGELQAFLASLSELGVEPVFRRSVVLRHHGREFLDWSEAV